MPFLHICQFYCSIFLSPFRSWAFHSARHTALHLFQLSSTKLSSPSICNTHCLHIGICYAFHTLHNAKKRGTRAHAHAKLSLPEDRRPERERKKNQTILWTTWIIICRCYFVEAEIRKWRENGSSTHKLHAFTSFVLGPNAAHGGAELQKIRQKMTTYCLMLIIICQCQIDRIFPYLLIRLGHSSHHLRTIVRRMSQWQCTQWLRSRLRSLEFFA